MRPYQPSMRVAGDRDRALGERLGVVVELGQVEVGDRAHALAARAHAAGRVKRALLLSLLAAALDVIAPAPRTDGTLKENALGEPMCGWPSRLKRIRSIALAVRWRSVERGVADIGTSMTRRSRSRRRPSGRAVGSITFEKGAGKTEKRVFSVAGGMCPRCEGMGSVTDIDLSQLYDDSKSLNEGALTIPGYTVDGWYGPHLRGLGLLRSGQADPQVHQAGASRLPLQGADQGEGRAA